jgi:uncharacterized protein
MRRYALLIVITLAAQLLSGHCCLSIQTGHAQVIPKASNPNKSRQKKSTSAITPPRVLEWDDLLPVDERGKPPAAPQGIRPLFDDEKGPPALQYGSSKINATLNGKLVKIPGFVAPVEMADRAHVKSFFLVPYYGACIHTPPPAPNQIVFVNLPKPLPVEQLYDARWVTGVLSTQSKSTRLADAAYSLEAIKVEEYIEPE